jgi:hypothetical protein
MTKFRSFLFEDKSRSVRLDMDDFIKSMDDYSDAIKNYIDGKRIYRGNDNAKGEILLTKPSEFNRVSANTLNFVTLIVDNMKEWDKYPKRSKSIICSSSPSNASDYGNPYIVLPKNGAKIGVCPESDWWYSFGEIMINNVNNLIRLILKSVDPKLHIDATNHTSDITDYKVLMELIRKFDSDEKYEKSIMSSNLSGVYKKIKGSNKTFEEAIIDYVSPDNYNFKLIDVKDYKLKRKNQELWTDGDSILIRESELVILLDKEGMLK